MTDTNTAPITLEDLEGLNDLEHADDTSAPAPTRRRRRVLITAGVVLALSIAGTATWLVLDHQHTAAEITTATTDLQTHRGELLSAQENLATDIAGAQETLDGAKGRVDDDTVRTDLANEITAATDLVAPLDLIGDPAPDLDTLNIQDAFVLSHTDVIASHVLSLAAATTAVDEAVATWELAQSGAALDTAAATLTTSIEAAGTTLSATEGQVTDEQVRIDLTAAIHAATTTRDTDVDRTDLDAVQTATTSFTTVTEALDAAHLSTQDAHTAWTVQREEEQAAADSAAAAAAQAAQNSSKSSTSTNSSSKNTSRSTTTPSTPAPAAPSTGTGARPPVTAPQTGEWIETITQESMRWCFDTSGASWQC